MFDMDDALLQKMLLQRMGGGSTGLSSSSRDNSNLNLNKFRQQGNATGRSMMRLGGGSNGINSNSGNGINDMFGSTNGLASSGSLSNHDVASLSSASSMNLMNMMQQQKQQAQQQPRPNSAWTVTQSSGSNYSNTNNNDMSAAAAMTSPNTIGGRRVSDISDLRSNPAFASILATLARSGSVDNLPSSNGNSNHPSCPVSNNSSVNSLMMQQQGNNHGNPHRSESSSSLSLRQQHIAMIQRRQERREKEQQEDMMAMASMMAGGTNPTNGNNSQNATFDSLMNNMMKSGSSDNMLSMNNMSSNNNLSSHRLSRSSLASLSSISSFQNDTVGLGAMPAPNQSWGNNVSMMNTAPSSSFGMGNNMMSMNHMSSNPTPGIGFWSAASQELLGDLAFGVPKDKSQQKKKSGKSGRKYSKDRPKRPLSAYNIFFKEERSRILDEVMEVPDAEKVIGSKKKDGQGPAIAQDLVDGMIRDRRNHPHGKIDFQILAKIIGKRWKTLPKEEFESYKATANKDMERYKAEMKVYQDKLASSVSGKGSA